MIRKTLIASSFALLASTAASAHASHYGPGAYFGASAGITDYPPGLGSTESYQGTMAFLPTYFFAMEASYIYLGEGEYDAVPDLTAKTSGLNLAAVGILPVNRHLDFFAKAGMYKWDIEVEGDGFGETEKEGADLSVGFGASVNVTERFSLFSEIQRFEVDDEALFNLSAGARLNF